ncbi:MAG TPA: rhomboid family intramembrane serine protease [Bacteroidia bacterium]|jgi:membrane associated rhomboid family serine protease|nr:rhomboid family intramembrane serine protease [Bacteroidia bacterium]
MNNFQSLPTITKNILIINIILFASTWLLKAKGLDLTNVLGLHYPTAPDFRPYQFITYMFMHGNIMHIFFNMYAVFMFGAILENVWGPKRFLFYYIFTGLGAAIIQLLVYYYQYNGYSGEQLNPLIVIGASGSLFGLLIAFGMLFPNSELMLMFIPIPIKAKYFVAGYGLIELFSGINSNPMDDVAHFAHLGGMLFGFILLLIWRVRKIN